MYLNNKIINFSKSEIGKYNIDDDKDLTINFITSFIKECYKYKIYQSSLDIYNLLNDNLIKNLSNIKNYIHKNKNILKQNKLPNNNDDICLVTYIYDDYDTGWFEYISNIFDNIFVINYTNNIYYLKNCKLLKSTNFDTVDIDTLLLCNDLKYHFNKIVILEDYKQFNIITNNTLSNDINYIREYLSFDIKNNILVNQLININHETFTFNKPFYIFKSNNNHVIFNNSIQISKISKTYSGALIISNNIFENKISQKNIYQKFKKNTNFKIDQINTIEEYIFSYYENNLLDVKIKLGEVIPFLKDKYNIEIYNPISYNFLRKYSNLIKYNNFDYQFFNESIIINFSNNLDNDFILLMYFTQLANRFKKKLFIKWNHKIKLNEIIIDDFYYVNECNDNIKNYQIKKFEDFDSNLLLHEITYINTKKINVFSLENKKFLKNIFKVSWNNILHDEIIKIDNIFKNENILLLDLDKNNTELISKVIHFDTNDLFELNKCDYIQNNKYKDILLLYVLINTNHIIYDKLTDYYKFLVNDLTDFNKLLQNSHILYKEDDIIKFKKIDYGMSFDNLLITNLNDNYYLNYLNDSKFISKAFIIADDSSWNTYKFTFISNNTTLGKCLNTLINKSKEKFIIISLMKNIDINFFYYNILQKHQFYYDENILYFSRELFKITNGFNEDINIKYLFYDFCTRANMYNYHNKYQLNMDYELLSFWGKEHIMTGIMNKIKKNYYLIN
jgi:hypothetical protein